MDEQAPKLPEPWVCPWSICNAEQAQVCRAERRPSKGCGGRFPGEWTLQQAREEICRPFNAAPHSKA